MPVNSLVINSDCQAYEFNTPPVCAVAGAVDVVVIAEGFTTFKLQGSSDGGATYGDIANSALTGDGTLAKRAYVSVYRSLFDHLKVVVDAGHVQIIRRWTRTSPPASGWPYPPANAVSLAANTKNVIDPQLGTP